MDIPSERRVHKELTPRMGGIIIYLAIVIVLFIFYNNIEKIRLIFISTFPIVVCGIIDDIWGLRWDRKLILQSIAAFLLILFYSPFMAPMKLFNLELVSPLNYIIMFLFIIGTLNAINMMDGLDGLVGGFSLVIFAIIIPLAYFANNTFLLILTVGIVGAIIGFLKYNAYPAQLFLGDTGSLIIGLFLIIATLSISIDLEHSIDLTLPIILLGIPIIDTLKVIIIRLYAKENPFMPDKNHLHHIFLEYKIGHKRTVFYIQILSLVSVFITFIYLKTSVYAAQVLFVITILLLVFVRQILRLLSNTSFGLTLVRGNDFPDYFIRFYKKGVIPIIVLVTILVLFSTLSINRVVSNSGIIMLVCFLTLILILSTYRNIRWSGYSEFYVLICWIIYFIFTTQEIGIMSNFSLYPYNFRYLIHLTSLIILSANIMLFLLLRKEIFATKLSILNGFDLIIVTIICLMFILRGFLKYQFPVYIGLDMLHAFLFYLSYKIVISIKPKLTKVFFYGSFAIAIGALLYQIILF